MAGRPRVIAHLDMDAFYAAVEVREDPTLAGRALIVGHRGPRGVVSTCSYEARRHGVRSAMPSVRAERLCPDAVWLPGRMAFYSEVSRAIRAILHDVTPLVEPISIDEAFLDLTGDTPDLTAGAERMARVQERIRTEQGLTCSVGVAPNKFLAKIASDLEKPEGRVVIAIADVPRRVWPLPVDRVWGVGPKTAERLRRAGLARVSDLARSAERDVAIIVGSARVARHLCRLARGIDDRPVSTDRDTKSISEERTYGRDLREIRAIERAILERTDGVASELRRDGLLARTVHLKIRTGEFRTWTRATTLPRPTDLAETLRDTALDMFRRRIRLRGAGVRLIGVGVSHLESASAAQGELFPDPGDVRRRKAARAVDAVRAKLGPGAVVRASSLGGRHRDRHASSPPALDPES